MTVRVERTFELDASPERVWQFIADPANRARAIDVVADFEVDPTDDRRLTWHVELPIPFVSRTTAVETRDVARDPPRFVEFTGRSSVMDVTGSHELAETNGGCRVANRFVVDGRVPGVERFFTRQLDVELENLRRAAERDIETGAVDEEADG
ncbi:SRPBCC family protein [Halovivax sp.]|uniref:SRPBCC family protein n=1 Tax=Halovivax sp. TaxID=1935978 RepID=UPI0025BC5851|nr:SRPBCC family protein [Halovivax sp.]